MALVDKLGLLLPISVSPEPIPMHDYFGVWDEKVTPSPNIPPTYQVALYADSAAQFSIVVPQGFNQRLTGSRLSQDIEWIAPSGDERIALSVRPVDSNTAVTIENLVAQTEDMQSDYVEFAEVRRNIDLPSEAWVWFTALDGGVRIEGMVRYVLADQRYFTIVTTAVEGTVGFSLSGDQDFWTTENQGLKDFYGW
jgi:hypothetical protein